MSNSTTPSTNYISGHRAAHSLESLQSNSGPQQTKSEYNRTFSEKDFKLFREKYCREMQGPFLSFCCYSLCLLLFLRIFILEFVNIMHSIILPTVLVLLFLFFKEKNNTMDNLNTYMLTILVPIVVLVVA